MKCCELLCPIHWDIVILKRPHPVTIQSSVKGNTNPPNKILQIFRGRGFECFFNLSLICYITLFILVQTGPQTLFLPFPVLDSSLWMVVLSDFFFFATAVPFLSKVIGLYCGRLLNFFSNSSSSLPRLTSKFQRFTKGSLTSFKKKKKPNVSDLVNSSNTSTEQ